MSSKTKNYMRCPKCGRENEIVNQCGCDPNNMPTRADDKPVPCGYEVAPGVCSIPGKSGRQPYDCANCNTGTQQNKIAVAKAKERR
jgi:hypothetical protein